MRLSQQDLAVLVVNMWAIAVLTPVTYTSGAISL